MLQHFKGHFSVLSSVEEVGLEPTQPEGNSFTDCPSSPTLAYFRIWLSWWLLVSRPDLSPLRHHLGFTLDRHSLCNNQIQSKPKEQSLIQYTKKTDNTKIFFYFLSERQDLNLQGCTSFASSQPTSDVLASTIPPLSDSGLGAGLEPASP
jgi:hypothetical protein